MKSDHSEQCKKFGSLGDIYDDCNCSPDGYKLVPADAIVLTDKEAFAFLRHFHTVNLAISIGSSFESALRKIGFNPKPPLAEPTGFGAIVEADAAGFDSRLGRKRWVLVGKYQNSHLRLWISEDGQSRPWSSLINPTLISEGQVK